MDSEHECEPITYGKRRIGRTKRTRIRSLTVNATHFPTTSADYAFNMKGHKSSHFSAHFTLALSPISATAELLLAFEHQLEVTTLPSSP